MKPWRSFPVPIAYVEWRVELYKEKPQVPVPPMLMAAQMKAEFEMLARPWPRDEFERYVRAMPAGEAQTALIFLVNYLADQAALNREYR